MATQPCGCETAPRKIRPTKECIYHSALEDRLTAAEHRASEAELRAAEALRVVAAIKLLSRRGFEVGPSENGTRVQFYAPTTLSEHGSQVRYVEKLTAVEALEVSARDVEALDNAVAAKETK